MEFKFSKLGTEKWHLTTATSASIYHTT